jgi:hypothetical protein
MTPADKAKPIYPLLAGGSSNRLIPLSEGDLHKLSTENVYPVNNQNRPRWAGTSYR